MMSCVPLTIAATRITIATELLSRIAFRDDFDGTLIFCEFECLHGMYNYLHELIKKIVKESYHCAVELGLIGPCCDRPRPESLCLLDM
jgi:hypothetical protein